MPRLDSPPTPCLALVVGHYGLPQTWASACRSAYYDHHRAARWRNRSHGTAATDDRPWAFDPGLLLQSIPSAVFSVDERLRFRFANPAAEQLFGVSWNVLAGRMLSEFVARHATITALVRQVQATATASPTMASSLRCHAARRWRWTAMSARCPSCRSTCSSCCIPVRWRAGSTSRSRTGARPARSPGWPPRWRTRSRTRLSGIRGAAQLLEPAVSEDDRPLIQLICDETDRICALVERMEEFGDTAADRARGGQHPSGAGACAPRRRGRLRPPAPHRRALRPVAARGRGRSRPARPGVPEPGQERRRGDARPTAARSRSRPSTSTGCGWP